MEVVAEYIERGKYSVTAKGDTMHITEPLFNSAKHWRKDISKMEADFNLRDCDKEVTYNAIVEALSKAAKKAGRYFPDVQRLKIR